MPAAKQPIKIDLMITEDMVEEALHQLAESIIPIGEAKGRVVKAEHMLKHVRAANMLFSGENAISAQERDALASNQYRAAIEEYSSATIQYEILKAQREHADRVISVFQTQSSNLRSMKV